MVWRRLWQRFVRNQRGMQTIEWIGIGLVVVALMSALASYFSGEQGAGKTIAQEVENRIKGMITDLGKGKDSNGSGGDTAPDAGSGGATPD